MKGRQRDLFVKKIKGRTKKASSYPEVLNVTSIQGIFSNSKVGC